MPGFHHSIAIPPLPFRHSIAPLPFFRSIATVGVARDNGDAGNVFLYRYEVTRRTLVIHLW